MSRQSGRADRAVTRITRSVRETEAAGAALARRLRAGACVRLVGPLGAGKTAFVRGAMRALGVREPAASPTFVLAREGRGRVPVAHLDLYRLDVPAAERGLADYLDGRFVTFIEWADREPGFRMPGALTVTIQPLGGNRRRITVSDPEGWG